MKVSVSILNSINREEDLKILNNTSCDYIHIDVMDGIFVNNKQFTIEDINNYSILANKKLDVHLMCVNPLEYINKLTTNNIEYITIHIEVDDIDNIIKVIKDKGYQVGIAINPDTDIRLLNKYLDIIDMVLIMSVNPGYGGQLFVDKVLDKIDYIKQKSNNLIISIDGGINEKSINKVKSKNIDMVVVGSYIIKSDNYEKKIINIK